jgi:DNA polymerase III alpha subunit
LSARIILSLLITAMSDVSSPSPVSSPAIDVETVYTTASPQGESTDWLTVVKNLRLTNRKLLDQIEALEVSLVAVKQESINNQERCRAQGIKIVQQEDDLQAARDRVAALFEQLENSHQIGQRQQVLVETLSQKLEIAQTIVGELDSENAQLRQNQTEQAQKLYKTEAVAQELYRRLKSQPAAEPAAPTSNVQRVQIAEDTAEHQDSSDAGPHSGPLEFEMEPIRPSWPAPAVEAAAEMKARPNTPLELPKFAKKTGQN